jgi:hypothetical protein
VKTKTFSLWAVRHKKLNKRHGDILREFRILSVGEKSMGIKQV